MISHSSSNVFPEDYAFVQDLATQNFVGHGHLCRQFEASLLDRFDRPRGILTSCGTSALEISLNAFRKIKPKAGRVIVSAYVCPAVVSAVLREGLEPVFVDVMPGSMNIDVRLAAERVDESTLAVVLTNLGGVPDDYEQGLKLECFVVSDCAQAIGATWNGVDLAALGHLAVISFGPTKMLTAGVGGALLTGDEEFFGHAKRYATEEWAVDMYKFTGFVPTCGQHFSDLNAGLGLAQLAKLDAMIDRRGAIARRYSDLLSTEFGFFLPEKLSQARENHYRYYFFSDMAKHWLALLANSGVDARGSIAHDMSAYFQGMRRMERLAENVGRVVSLPIYPSMTDGEAGHVLSVLRRGYDQGFR